MSMINSPVWTLAHVGLKFPGATICACVCGVAAYMLSDDNRPMVVMTFDDGYESVYTEALPLLSSYEIPATFYPALNFIGKENYMSPRQVKSLTNLGWEIGAHTIDHTNITKMSSDDLINTLVYPVAYLANMSGQQIVSFASPYGEFDETSLEKVKLFYGNHVNAWSPARGMNYVESFDQYNIHRLDVDDAVTAEYVCNELSDLPENSMFVLLFHDITTAEGRWNIAPDKLQQIVECVDNANVNTVNITEATIAMLEKKAK